MLLLEEERLRLIEEKELVRLMEAERKAFLVDQRRAPRRRGQGVGGTVGDSVDAS